MRLLILNFKNIQCLKFQFNFNLFLFTYYVLFSCYKCTYICRKLSIMEDITYRVRVLFNDIKHSEKIEDGLNYVQAKRKFLFYVTACLEFDNDLNVRCVNIFRGKTCVKYYQNYSSYERRRQN